MPKTILSLPKNRGSNPDYLYIDYEYTPPNLFERFQAEGRQNRVQQQVMVNQILADINGASPTITVDSLTAATQEQMLEEVYSHGFSDVQRALDASVMSEIRRQEHPVRPDYASMFRGVIDRNVQEMLEAKEKQAFEELQKELARTPFEMIEPDLEVEEF